MQIILSIESIRYNRMKTTQRLKDEVYREVQQSGLLKSVQAQLKAQIFDIIEHKNNQSKDKIPFQYQHPLLTKLNKYPGTALCMNLIQQFLESFKFKHTLNVFKKQINKEDTVNRIALSKELKVQNQSQSVLLSIVQSIINGNVPVRLNNFVRENTQKNNIQITDQHKKIEKNDPVKKNNQSNKNNISQNIKTQGNTKITQQNEKNKEKNNIQVQKIIKSQNNSNNAEKSTVKKEKQPIIKKQSKPQPPPQAATDLLSDLMTKFSKIVPQDKEKQKKQLFESKKAFSQEKQKKILDPSQSGKNKIRGASATKPNSFLSKFLPQAAVKNQSIIDEELDQFQQSKDSTKKNPLFSSNESGFDKSGFDKSVDSNAIQDYEYSQKAKKFNKNR